MIGRLEKGILYLRVLKLLPVLQVLTVNQITVGWIAAATINESYQDSPYLSLEPERFDVKTGRGLHGHQGTKHGTRYCSASLTLIG